MDFKLNYFSNYPAFGTPSTLKGNFFVFFIDFKNNLANVTENLQK